MAATRSYEYSAFETVLYLDFELSHGHWRLGFTTGPGQRPRQRTINARDLEALRQELRRAKKRFNLPESTRVVSCYEAGRDGFWLHRYLIGQGIENLVVDSSSIQVNRRSRQAKTDRMDVEKLLRQLICHPSVEAEDKRQLHRELQTLKKDRTRHINRIKSFLVGQGIRVKVRGDVLKKLERARKWDGSPIAEGLRARIEREYRRLEVVRKLLKLKGIGPNAGWLFGMEFFSWRK